MSRGWGEVQAGPSLGLGIPGSHCSLQTESPALSQHSWRHGLASLGCPGGVLSPPSSKSPKETVPAGGQQGAAVHQADAWGWAG